MSNLNKPDGIKDAAAGQAIQPFAALVIAIIAASTSSILIRFAQREAPSIVIAAYRLSIAALLLLPLLAARYRAEVASISRRHWSLALAAGVFLALHFATWITSLEFTTVASSVVLVQTSPLFVALLSPFLLREKPGRIVLAGMMLAFAGSLVIGLGDLCPQPALRLCPQPRQLLSGDTLRGDLLALAGAFAGAGYLMIGRRVRARLSLIPYIGIVYSAAAIILVLWAMAAGMRLTGFPIQTYLWLLLLALLPQLLAHSTYNWALRHLSAATVSISLLGEPVSATILAFIILDEVPSSLRIAGAILILIGVTIALRQSAGQEIEDLPLE